MTIQLPTIGSIDKAVDNAIERECSAFQIFTRNPRGWHAKELTKEDIANFKSKLKASKIDRLATCAHMPYLPNLATPKQDGFEKTDEIFLNIKRKFDAFLDHSGAIGRRYRRLDEVGAPFAVTVDHQTLEDNTVTIRKRDSMEQTRINISEIDSVLSKSVAFP